MAYSQFIDLGFKGPEGIPASLNKLIIGFKKKGQQLYGLLDPDFTEELFSDAPVFSTLDQWRDSEPVQKLFMIKIDEFFHVRQYVFIIIFII